MKTCFALQNEVNWLGKIRHQNIIKLLGYCVHGKTRFLVYEMMQNGSLETQLYGMNFLLLVSSNEMEKNIGKWSHM